MPDPREKINPYSSWVYWVMKPDGYTSHFLPSTPIVRAGMLELDLLIYARWIECLVRRFGVRVAERLLVGGFGEFDERPGKRCLFEHPELAIRRRVVRAKRL